jgi:hypothetical protein
MTIELCKNECKAAGFTIAGVEFHDECYCGNTLPPNRAPAASCYYDCKGNPLQTCGGSAILSVYQLYTYFPSCQPCQYEANKP